MADLTPTVEKLFHADLGPAGKWFLLAVCALLTGLAGVIRVATEAQHAFSLILLLPTIAASWYIGLYWGVSVAMLAVVSWLGADLFVSDDLTPQWIAYSNALVRGGVFCLVAYITAALRDSYRRQRALASQDPLTGLANRRQFMARLELERQRSVRSRLPISIGYLDLDDFKTVNDKFGHATGDEVLKVMGAFLSHHLRETDCAARLGGDEFAVMFSEIEPKSALIVLDKVRRSLEERLDECGYAVGLSVGVASFITVPRSAQEMLHTADRAMYEVKQDGKGSIRHVVVDGAPRDAQ